jgi:hypothetical protein
MPVETIIQRGRYSDGHAYEIKKPVYWCRCGAPARFGLTVVVGGKRKREWFCGWINGSPQCKGAKE